MFIASDTDIGKKRSENQDRVHAEFLADNVAVAVVCDGMGGASSGGVASQLAIDAVVKRIKENFRKDMKPNSIRNLMLTSVHYANTIVYGKSKEDIDKNAVKIRTECMLNFLLTMLPLRWSVTVWAERHQAELPVSLPLTQ